METITFKTTIKCSGCVDKVTPFLDASLGEQNWKVDVNNPSKILTVSGETDAAKVMEALALAGYKAEKI